MLTKKLRFLKQTHVVAIEALAIYITSGKFHWLGIVLGKKTMKESLPAKYPAQKFPPVTMQKSFD